jgi:RecB family exonuclease
MTSGQLADAFHAEWAKVRLDDPQQHALYERRGATQLRELATRYPRGSSEVIATEQAFLFQLGPLEVRGRMDRIDALPGNRVNILDYKTGKPRRSEHADKSLQLSIYAMAAEQLGYKVEGLAFINLENGETMTTQRDPGTLEDAREQIQKAADGIARGEFEANPGFHCRWCAYKDLCPATEESLVTIGAAGPKGVN